jgi:adenosylcobinamide-phosphate synthase
MTFLSILCALLLEQMKPLRADNPIYAEIKSLALRMETWFNAGHSSHGRLGWFLMMAILMVPTALIYWVLKYYDWFLAAFAWNVLVVYLTLGFRHYSHYFTSIQLHLSAGDDAAARDVKRAPAGSGQLASRTGCSSPIVSLCLPPPSASRQSPR